MGKKARSSDEKAMKEWEAHNILPYKVKQVMKTMWEIPQIFHFLHLTKESLGLPDMSMYELERMFLAPQASKQMAQIMTSLLSHVGMNKAKLKKMPPMPYEFWTNILAYKLKNWFKVYDAKKGDTIKVLESIGIEPQFWTVFPDSILAKGKNFEDLTLLQRIWLVKTVCDTLMHSRKSVQDEIAKQPWESLFETVLGTDRDGAKYVYFPQFLNSDLRIYRHCLDNTILSTVKPKKERKTPIVSPKKIGRTPLEKGHITRRYTRWKKGLPELSKKSKLRIIQNRLNRLNKSKTRAGSLVNEDANLSSASGCGNNNNNSNSDNDNTNLEIVNGKRSRRSSHCSEASIESDKAHCKDTESSICDANCSVGATSAQQASQKMFQGFSSTSDDKRSIEETNGLFQMEADNRDVPLVDNSQNQIKLGAVDNLSSISKTDDEKLNEIISAECLKLTGKGSCSFQISTVSKSDDEKLNETRTSQNGTEEDNVSFVEEKRENGIVTKTGQSVEPMNLDNDSNDTEVESSDENLYLKELRIMLQKDAMEDHCSAEETTEMEYSEETSNRGQETEDFYKMLLDLSVSKFQLVADSVNSLRDLISTFKADSDDTNSVNTESIPLCEVQLIKNLTELLSTVEKIEPALVESTKNARAKLRKEWNDYKERAVHYQKMKLCELYRNVPYPQLIPKRRPKEAVWKKEKTRSLIQRASRIKAKTSDVREKEISLEREKREARAQLMKAKREMEKKPTKKKPAKKQTRKNSKPEECYEPAASHRTRNSYIRMKTTRRTIWENGPRLREFTQIQMQKQPSPPRTLLRKSNSRTSGQTKKTRTKSGYYRALGGGKTNVRLQIED